MNKQTKMYLGIGLVAVGGYLLYKQMTKNSTEETTTTNFRGMKRKMVGVNGQGGQFFNVQQPKF